jgi:hypothetical protein
MKPSLYRSCIRRPLPLLLTGIAFVLLIGCAWTYRYARRRLAAIASVESSGGGVAFDRLTEWRLSWVAVPRWLRSVEMVHTGERTVTDLRSLTPLRELTTLCCYHCDIDDREFRELQNFPYLKSLRLGDTRVTDAGMPVLRHCRRLEVLDLESP